MKPITTLKLAGTALVLLWYLSQTDFGKSIVDPEGYARKKLKDAEYSRQFAESELNEKLRELDGMTGNDYDSSIDREFLQIEVESWTEAIEEDRKKEEQYREMLRDAK